MVRFAAIVPASGRSMRFGQDKLMASLCSGLVIHRTILSLWNHEFAERIVVATDNPAVIAALGELSAGVAAVQICPGGPTRAHSVLSALRQVPASVEWVAVHDAARPLVSVELIDRTLAAAIEHGAAAPALPLSLTVKQAAGPLPAKVQRTVPRHTLFAMQTPQIMRRRDLLEAYEKCPLPLDQITDDIQLLELAGRDVWLVPGDEQNLKITTPLDLKLAALLLEEI